MSIFCQDKLMLYDLNLIKGVKGFQRGHKGLSIDNRHFDIMIYFKQDAMSDEEENTTYKMDPVRILDTNNVVKASQQVKIINEFLGVTTDINRDEIKKRKLAMDDHSNTYEMQEEVLGVPERHKNRII